MSKRPTLILVHGAWHQPACFDQLKAQLSPHFTVHIPARPSVGAEAATKSFDDDVRMLQARIAECTDRDEAVFIVAHSAAGYVAPPAIQNLTWKERKQQGQKGGVVGMALIAAFIPPADRIMFEGLEMDVTSLEWIAPTVVMPKSPAHLFYNDLPDATAQHWVQELLPSHLGTPQTLTYEGWRHVPVFYLFCEHDNALSLKLQESMIAKARAHGADILTEKFNSGHSPFLSMPEATAKWVDRSVREAEKLAGI